MTAHQTTLSIERAVLRMLGVTGTGAGDVPMVNMVVDQVHRSGLLGLGISYWIGAAMLHTKASIDLVASEIASGALRPIEIPRCDPGAARRAVEPVRDRRIHAMDLDSEGRRDRRDAHPRHGPLRYVLSATGDIQEDIVHALAIAEHGGDIVAMIRSTTQSLLDYVPEGSDMEGFGGTFATQENFRAMRGALDQWSAANGRYLQLSSFCSGLCMPEIAALGALEGLDNMVNDALYGILFRDINPRRTLIDQHFSRQISGRFGLCINTGEDNYLRAANALEAAPIVVASQFINYHLAVSSGVPEGQIALGNAFEIDPSITNGLLFELAHARLTRDLFPHCPVKYMPPTKHKTGDPVQAGAYDTLFTLVAVATGQSIQTVGVVTESMFTPHIHDKVQALKGARYVENFARDLAGELQFRPNGIVQERARSVLHEAQLILAHIADIGLLPALGEGMFGDVSRTADGGRGADGIVPVEPGYINAVTDAIGRTATHA